MRFTVMKRRQLAVINELQERIGVAEIGKDSGILGLFYENRDPVAAEAFLHQVALAYVRQNVERNSAEASAQLSFVKEQLPGIRMQVETSQKALSEFQMRENSVDLSLQTKGLLDQGWPLRPVSSSCGCSRQRWIASLPRPSGLSGADASDR